MKKFLMISLILSSLVVVPLFGGAVLSVLWLWFLEPITSIELSVLMAAGILLTIKFTTLRGVIIEKEPLNLDKLFYLSYTKLKSSVAHGIVALLFGWIISLFM